MAITPFINVSSSNTTKDANSLDKEFHQRCKDFFKYVNEYSFANYGDHSDIFRFQDLLDTRIFGELIMKLENSEIVTQYSIPLERFHALDSTISVSGDGNSSYLDISKTSESVIEVFRPEPQSRVHTSTVSIPFPSLEHAQEACRLLHLAIQIAVL